MNRLLNDDKNITSNDISDIITSQKKDMNRMIFIQSCIEKDIADLTRVRSAHKTTPELITLKKRSSIFEMQINAIKNFLQDVSVNTGIVQEVKQELTDSQISKIKRDAIADFLEQKLFESSNEMKEMHEKLTTA